MTDWMIAMFGAGCWLTGVVVGLNWWKVEERLFERRLLRRYRNQWTPQQRPRA